MPIRLYNSRRQIYCYAERRRETYGLGFRGSLALIRLFTQTFSHSDELVPCSLQLLDGVWHELFSVNRIWMISSELHGLSIKRTHPVVSVIRDVSL